MPYQCPKCSSRKTRLAHSQTLTEKVLRKLGWYVLRCQECDERFLQHFLMPDKWIYAKCPRCYRMDLTSWNPAHYRATGTTRLRLAFGARRMRCEVCRCNFASFRLRRGWYRRPEPLAQATETPPETREAASGR